VATLIVIALCAAAVGLILFAWAICAAAGMADDDMERALSEERHARNARIKAELRQPPQDSDRAIAKRVGCSHRTVGAHRKRLGL
jgi:hypothetical protein